MQETTRVFAVLGDAPLRRQVQQQWRGNGTTLCGMHAESSDSLVEEITRMRPDVVVIDVETDGARALIQAAATRLRVPVVALVRAQQPSFTALRPFEWGAATVVVREADSVQELAGHLEAAVRDVHDAQVVDVMESHFPLSGAFPDASVFDLRRNLQTHAPSAKIVAVGAGVGGPMAVRRILTELRTAVVSPVVVAQRLPEALMPAFVQWLEHHTGTTVVRAVSGPLEVGTVYVVPSGCEARVESHSGAPTLSITATECATAPGFDVLFESVAATYGDRGIAVVLTGRGSDGAQGLVAVRRAGGLTIVQDRVSSLVFEAAGHARDGGGAIECLPINEIAERIQMLMRAEPAGRS